MAKNIVVCCDGTGNESGEHDTNVIKTFKAAIKHSEEQIAFYDPGIGTAYNRVKKMVNQAFATGISRNIVDAYAYLMTHYEPGDNIYLFGFSRGAFTVRSLAGMLYKCGLLHKGSGNLLEYAIKAYNMRDNAAAAAAFKETLARPCPVHFIGVWDTVASLGLLTRKKFYDQTLNPEVRHGYHALAIDELRFKFLPSLWDETKVDPASQTVEQVWFAGVHSDVGGWYDERGLSYTALLWMLNHARNAGMLLEPEKLAEFKGDPHDHIHQSYSGFWKLLGKAVRPISDGAKIHESVFERRDREANGYQPKNLPKNFQKVARQGLELE